MRFAVTARMICLVAATLAVGLVTVSRAQNAPAVPAASQPTSAPAKDLPKAADIIKSALDAMGGKKAYDDIKSTSIKATISTQMMGDMTMEMKSAKPASFFIHQTIPGMGETTMGSNGTIGWMDSPMLGGVNLMEGEQLEQMGKQSNMFRTVFSIDEDFPTVETVDRVKMNDQDCYKVKMTAKDPEQPSQFGYFSVEKKLPVAMEMTQEGPMGAAVTTMSFSEWKEISKLQVFHKMTMAQGPMEMTMTFTEVEFDKVEPSAFEPPPAVLELVKKKEAEAASQPATAPSEPGR